ncbi:putative secreted protein [Ixodes scapularis]
MFMTLAIAALLALQAAAEPPEDPKCQYAWASLGTSGGDLHIHDGKPGQGAVAWGSFQNDIHFSGWTFLEVQSNGSYADDAQAYAAGAVEAHLTHDLMEKQYNNMYSRYCNGQPEYCERLLKFLLQNLEYSNSQERLHESTDPYWHMARGSACSTDATIVPRLCLARPEALHLADAAIVPRHRLARKMFMILAFAALLVLQAAAQPTEEPKCQYAWASLGTPEGELHIHDGKPGQGAVAWASFQNDIHISGWTFLEVQSNGSYADDAQAYAAGAVEAYLTQDLMANQFNNMYNRYCEGQMQYCERLIVFLQQNLRYSNIQENLHASTDPYWHMVHLQMKQLAGLSDQFENKTLIVSNEYLDITRALFLNIEGDLLDLEKFLKRVPDEYSMDQTPACSALIKVVADNDILFAHNTWFGYRKMLRIEKKYTFPWQLTSKSSKCYLLLTRA